MAIRRIALLGVDGSGKSTMAGFIKEHLEHKGYKVRIVPFHKWIIAGLLRDIFGKTIDSNRNGRNAPYKPKKKSFSAFIKPPIAFIDNVLFLLLNSPRKKKHIYIYDRYICATQIKFAALDYTNNWFKRLWWSFKPDFAFVFNVGLEESVKRQLSRNDPYAYPKEILEKEMKLYLEYAERYGFPVIQSEGIESTKRIILKQMDSLFQ